MKFSDIKAGDIFVFGWSNNFVIERVTKCEKTFIKGNDIWATDNIKLSNNEFVPSDFEASGDDEGCSLMDLFPNFSQNETDIQELVEEIKLKYSEYFI